MDDETLALTESLRIDTLSGETDEFAPPLEDSFDAPTEDPAVTSLSVEEQTRELPVKRVGRYRVLHKLGEGGMGVVFAAYDDELARPIALKLLRTRKGMNPAKAAEARERMQREAQAMAQLSHANVVQVYDVGQHDDEVFIAMELISGRTLAEWLRELGPPTKRSAHLREILEVFAQAGRGLAAAHGVGLVHRDFKPANVLVGNDGVVRVLDFGLARGAADTLGASGDTLDLDSSNSSRLTPMTRTGTLLGTPAYFSPEQMRAEPLDPASDQFSFCVVLHEALYGVRPHAAQTFAQLRESLRDDVRAPLPSEVSVPSWLRIVLDRGLELDPLERWPSMDALIYELLDDPVKRRRQRVALALIVSIAIALASGLWLQEHRATARCEALATDIDDAWTDTRRLELMEAFAHSGAGERGYSWARLEPKLDDWRTRWRNARREACELERAGDRQSRARASCLERQRWQLESLLAVLAKADRSAVFEAPNAVAALPPPARCSDPGWLASEPPPSPWWSTQADAAKRVRRDLAEVFALERVADYAASEQLAERALARARALGDESLEAEALAKLGAMRWRSGDDKRAELELAEAHFLAGAIDYDRVASSAALELVGVVGVRLERPDEGRMWLRLARMHLRSMGVDPDEDRRLWFWRGELEYSAGRYPEALAAHERAYAIAQATLPPGHPDVATSLTSLGQVHRQLDDFEAALAVLELGLELKRDALGPAHPSVAYIHDSIAAVLTELRRPDAALAAHASALAIAEPTLGATHPNLATLRNNYATALYLAERYDEAAEQFEGVLAVREQLLGPEHREVALVLNNLAAVEAERGQLERAVELIRRVLTIEEASLGPMHAELSSSYYNLGLWLERLGQLDEALSAKLRALDIHARSHGEDDLEYARLLRHVARVRASLGEHERALTEHRRVLAIRKAQPEPPAKLIASSMDDVGAQLRALGRFEDALAMHREALAMREAATGPEHPSLARTLLPLAEALASMRRCDEARAVVTRALGLIDAAASPERHARAQAVRATCPAPS